MIGERPRTGESYRYRCPGHRDHRPSPPVRGRQRAQHDGKGDQRHHDQHQPGSQGAAVAAVQGGVQDVGPEHVADPLAGAVDALQQDRGQRGGGQPAPGSDGQPQHAGASRAGRPAADQERHHADEQRKAAVGQPPHDAERDADQLAGRWLKAGRVHGGAARSAHREGECPLHRVRVGRYHVPADRIGAGPEAGQQADRDLLGQLAVRRVAVVRPLAIGRVHPQAVGTDADRLIEGRADRGGRLGHDRSVGRAGRHQRRMGEGGRGRAQHSDRAEEQGGQQVRGSADHLGPRQRWDVPRRPLVPLRRGVPRAGPAGRSSGPGRGDVRPVRSVALFRHGIDGRGHGESITVEGRHRGFPNGQGLRPPPAQAGQRQPEKADQHAAGRDRAGRAV